MKHKLLSLWDLRRNLPEIRTGLKRGGRYVLLYRGKPVGELLPPSDAVRDLVFTKQQKRRAGAERIKRNVERRRRKRLQKR